MFVTRLFTTLGLIALLLSIILIDLFLDFSAPAIAIATLLVATSAYELYGMARHAGHRPFIALGVIAAVLAFNLPWLATLEPLAWLTGSEVVVAGTLLLAFWGLLARKERQNALADIAVTIFGVAYVGILAGMVTAVYVLGSPVGHGAQLLLYYVAVAKLSDIGGYVAGKSIGRHKLAPVVSPNKTWEGSAGGMLLSIAAAIAMAGLLPEAWNVSLWWTILFAVGVNVSAQFGDLAESIIKRACGVKDSAVFLPKVCGALDLLDSLLISAPVAYYLLLLAKGA